MHLADVILEIHPLEENKMSITAEIDPGICGFLAAVSASTDDQQHVLIDLESECESMQILAGLLGEISPIDAYAEMGPDESVVLKAARSVLQSRGCCEACVVPAAICKTVHVAAGLALPKDVFIRMEASE